MNYINKYNSKILIALVYFFIFCIFFIFVKTLYNYEGNKIYYILFSLIFNFTIFKVFFKKVYLFELFFGFMLWLGFWFKFSIFESDIYRNSLIFDGRVLCNFNLENFDQVLLVSSYGCIGFILSIICFNFIKKFLSQNKVQKYELINKNFLYALLILFLSFYILFVSANFFYEIYQKGLEASNDMGLLTKVIFPYLYNIGFGAGLCFLIYNLHNYNSNFFFLIIVLIAIEGFFTNLSMLSRNMVLYSSSIFLGYALLINENSQIKYFRIKLMMSYFILLSIFFISIMGTNLLRNNKYQLISNQEIVSKSDCLIKEKESYFKGSDLLKLFITRSIGIEGVISTQINKNLLGFDLIKKSLNENVENDQSFYEKKFLKNQNRLRNYKNSNQVILPGIFGYLYFSGSVLFLSSSLFLICFICLCFEKIILFYTNNNVLCSFLVFCIVWRLINFGYLVSNTLNFILSLVFTLVIIHFAQLFLHGKYKK